MDAVLLGATSEKSRTSFGYNKCMIKYNGESMFEIAIRASRQADCIDRIFAVAFLDDVILDELALDGFIEPTGDVLDNIQACLDVFGIEGEFFIISTDLPFISAESITEFYNRTRMITADFYYPVITKSSFQQLHGGYKKTFLPIAGEKIASGSVFIAGADVIRKNMTVGRECFNRRKSPLQMARLMGIGNIIRFIFHRLALRDIEKIIYEKTGYLLKTIVCNESGLILDIDSKKQLDYVVSLWNGFEEPLVVRRDHV